MTLIRKLPKREKVKADPRWRSQHYRKYVRSHCCCVCGCDIPTRIEAAHLRLGTDGAMDRKPSDYFALPLCGGEEGCHPRQHREGEASFWKSAGIDPMNIIEELIRSYPRRAEIEEHRRNEND